jgi:hypothetical protein
VDDAVNSVATGSPGISHYVIKRIGPDEM